MKHILINEDKTSPFDTIVQFGCGPKFVLNRRKAFEIMIKEQGFLFWFRFWLCFCIHSKYEAKHEPLPDIKIAVLIEIHKLFLQGSVEEAIYYCLCKAVMKLVFPPEHFLTSEKLKPKQKLKDLLQECSDMAFGAALCEIFYKWIFAKSNADAKSCKYWTLPKQYMDPNFNPGILEEFLAVTWKSYLPTLLGISPSNVPNWLNKLMKTAQPVEVNINKNLLQFEENFLRKMHKVLKIRRNLWREKISLTDEAAILSQIFRDLESNESIKFDCEGNFATKGHIKWNEHSPLKCSWCRNSERSVLYNICKHCEAVSSPEPRYYCSDACECKVEHSFQVHHKEHFGIQLPHVYLKTFQRLDCQKVI